MKKILLLIVIIICFFCLGCNYCTSAKKDVSNYEFLDNGSEEIRNIKNFFNAEVKEDPSYSFSMLLDWIKFDDYYTFYLTRMGNIKYFICAYLDPNNYEESEMHDKKYFSQFKWIKFLNESEIEKNIDGLRLSCKFAVRDYYIEKDVINNLQVNKHKNFYEEASIKNATVNVEMANNDKYYLMFGVKHAIYDNDYAHFDLERVINSGFGYEALLDNNDIFIIFKDEIMNYKTLEIQNCATNELNEYYDYLCPFFIKDESLIVKYNNTEIRKIKINFDVIRELIKGSK